MKARVSSKIPSNPVTNGPCQWRLVVSARFGIMSCCRAGARVGLNGETLQRPKRAAAHRSTGKPSGRYEKTGLERPRRSESGEGVNGWWCSIGACRGAAVLGKLRASPIVRSWSRNPKLDTRLRHQGQEGAACSSVSSNGPLRVHCWCSGL